MMPVQSSLYSVLSNCWENCFIWGGGRQDERARGYANLCCLRLAAAGICGRGEDLMSHYVFFLNISVYLSLKARVEGSSGAHDPVCSTLHLKCLLLGGSARVWIVRNPVSSRVRLRTACWHITQLFNFHSPFLSVGIAPLHSHRRARFAHPFPSQTTRGLSCSHELPSVVNSGRGAGFWRGDLLSLACFFFSFLDGSGIDDGPSTQFAEVSSAVVLLFF